MVGHRRFPGRRLPPDPKLALPRRVEDTCLYRAVQEKLRSFLDQAEHDGRTVPRFVERELNAFLACGIPAHGWVVTQ